MAIQKTIKTEFDTDFENAYIKITEYHGDKNRIWFNVNALTTKNGKLVRRLYNIIENSATEYTCEIDINENVLAQAYNYLKSLPEFSNALDI